MLVGRAEDAACARAGHGWYAKTPFPLMFASFGGGCLWLVLSILDGFAFYFVGISEQFQGGHQFRCRVPRVAGRRWGAGATHVPGVRDASTHTCAHRASLVPAWAAIASLG